MEVDSVFVTGANRGIGLEFVKQLVALPKPPRLIFATYRNRDAVQDLKKIRDETKTTEIHLIKMDVRHPKEIESAKKITEDMVGESGLTLLINNAGAAQFAGFPDVTEEDMIYHFNTNTIGPLSVFKEMYPLLVKAAAQKPTGMSVSRAAVLNISSTAGSMTCLSPDTPKEYLQLVGYRSSKAALNMAMRVAAFEIKDQGVLVVQMCPGWVKTGMGGEKAQIEVTESVSGMIDTLPTLNDTHHGGFVDRHGNNIPF